MSDGYSASLSAQNVLKQDVHLNSQFLLTLTVYAELAPLFNVYCFFKDKAAADLVKKDFFLRLPAVRGGASQPGILSSIDSPSAVVRYGVRNSAALSHRNCAFQPAQELQIGRGTPGKPGFGTYHNVGRWSQSHILQNPS